jgi:uncharacterized membrane protein
MDRIFTFAKDTLVNAQLEVYVMAAAIGFFAGLQAYLIIIGLLVFIDLFTGIKRSRKVGIKCTWSHGLRRTWEKVGGYGVIIVTFGLVDEMLELEQGIFVITAAKTASLLIAMTEAKSITENISISMGDSLATRIFNAINKAWKEKVVTPSIYDELKDKEEHCHEKKSDE